LVLHRRDRLAAEKIRALRAWLNERQRRKPLAYVCGVQPFRDLQLIVTPDVLIPRPETELLVEQAMRVLDSMRNGDQFLAVDVGTGSGAIALCLSAHPKVAKVLAVDIMPEALQVARRNANKNRRTSIEWIQGDLLARLMKRRIRADLVVANLPYVRSSDMRRLEPELHWEPATALDGGGNGLRFIRPCAQQAAEVLRPGGWLLLEIGADQAPPVTELLKRHGDWTDIQVFRDLAGLPRIVQCKRKDI
jgi:release factor glutamine methyltransferase